MHGAMLQSQPWSVSSSQFSGPKLVTPEASNVKTPHRLGVRASGEREVKAKVAVESPSESVIENRLLPRLEKKEGYWVLREEFRTSLNPAEKIKLEKDPMKLILENEIAELAKTPFAEIDSSKPGKDDIDVRLKWLGLFHRRKRQYGRFMVRFKLPNGITNSTQTRFLANFIAKYGKEGCADLTTRQNWQIRGVVLEDVPALFKGLEEVGLSSLQSGMDNVRNPVGNPLAGIDPDEIVDTAPFCRDLSDYIINRGKGNVDITNLPRKWNVAVVGTHDLFEHPHINDLAYMPAKKGDVFGFNILVGGFFSPKRCAEAVPLDAWVPAEDVVPLCKAVLETYRDLGTRGNRQKTRMMWLIDEMGIEEFRSEVENRMPKGSPMHRAGDNLVDPTWKRRTFYGVHPQKQEGLNYIGLHVPVGRLQAPEMLELARIADEYGNGEIRITVEQNLILPNVPTEKVEKLMTEPLLQIYSPNPTPLLSTLVACTGSQFCGQAIAETKALSLQLTQELDATMEVTWHIVIQRCEESSIPLTLVSDVLESCYGEVHHSSSNRQLLLRTPTGEDGQIRQPSLQSMALSLEDREAAYQAARERIFSDPLLVSEDPTEHKETQRVRPVPIVARRMIAHALGKPSVLATVLEPNEMSTSSEKISPEVLKEALVHSSAKAARRMLTQALGFPVSNPSFRGAERQSVKKQIPVLANEAGYRQSVVHADVVSTEGLHHVERIEATELDNDCLLGESRGKDSESACPNEADHRNIEATPRKTICKNQPGAAACRIFAKALGLPQTVPCPQSMDENRANHNSTMAQLDSAGGKTISSVNLNNMQCFSEEGTSTVDWLTRPVESTTGSFNRRSTGSVQVKDHSKLNVVLQEEVRKGGGKGHKVENWRRLKKQVFQEDHETGELFLISNHKNMLKASPQTKG